jgi:CRP/FNR family transcriptional regulator, cyclic AMP receptor protein
MKRRDAGNLFLGGALDSETSFDVESFAANYGGVTVSRLRSGSLLYSQGEPADALYYLQHGQIQITVVSSQGKGGILSVIGPGGFCGEGCLLGNRRRVATAVCRQDSVVARLEAASVIRAVRQDPKIAELFLLVVLKKVSRLREGQISQLFDSSEKRLARALLLLANQGRDDGAPNVVRNVDQEALAQMIGTTRSRVNVFMNKFRRLRYIDYDGNVIVVHRALSNAVLDDDSLGESDDGMAMAC